jgi:hypothetical protein
VAFAAKTRLLPGLVTPNTERAVKVFCGCSVEEAAAVVDEAYDDLPRGGDIPPYEVWRQRTRDRFR